MAEMTAADTRLHAVPVTAHVMVAATGYHRERELALLRSKLARALAAGDPDGGRFGLRNWRILAVGELVGAIDPVLDVTLGTHVMLRAAAPSEARMAADAAAIRRQRPLRVPDGFRLADVRLLPGPDEAVLPVGNSEPGRMPVRATRAEMEALLPHLRAGLRVMRLEEVELAVEEVEDADGKSDFQIAVDRGAYWVRSYVDVFGRAEGGFRMLRLWAVDAAAATPATRWTPEDVDLAPVAEGMPTPGRALVRLVEAMADDRLAAAAEAIETGLVREREAALERDGFRA